MKITQRRRLPDKIPFTKEGYEKIKSDIAMYTEKRKGAVIALRTAREMGDLSENGAYKAARFELSDIDRYLRRLNFQLRFGFVQENNHSSMVGFGNTVTLKNNDKEMTFMLVNSFESDPKSNKLSIHSPIGKAILGRRQGDTVIVHTPSGTSDFTIVEFS